MARRTLQLKLKPSDMLAGRYVVMKKLGEGGCGSVYRCRMAKKPEVEVAVKVLENSGELPRFEREKKVMRGVTSNFTVPLLDAGSHDGHPYLVMEFMGGGSLRDVLDERGRLPIKEAAWALVMAVRGLRHARTLHRDLKPDNLLLSLPKEGGKSRLIPGDIRKGSVVKVADFGLAKNPLAGNTVLTNTGQIMGTPLYMSPEQCRNTRDVTVASDIYALGIIFFEMLTGDPPFDGDSAYDIMTMHCNDPVKWPRGLDPKVQAVLERCLAKQAKDRYRSLVALERDLGRLAGLGEPEPDRTSWTTWVVAIGGGLIFCLVAWLLHDKLLEVLRRWLSAI